MVYAGAARHKSATQILLHKTVRNIIFVVVEALN